MTSKSENTRLIPLLKSSINTLFSHPVIFVPFMTVTFIQLLILEVFYFAPRFPLSVFFAPIIRKLFGEAFLHYPYNFFLIPKIFQTAQIPLYIFVSSFFIAAAVAIIATVNSGRKITFAKACRQAFSRYVHVLLAAMVSFGIFYGLSVLFGLVIRRALAIRSVEGPYFILKATVLHAAPYVNVLIGVFVTALFAFVIPIIMIEKKKIFGALLANFRALWGSVWVVLLTVLIPTLLYVPVLIFRSTVPSQISFEFPSIKVWVIVAGVLVMFFIDAVIYTTLTIYYLLKKENV